MITISSNLDSVVLAVSNYRQQIPIAIVRAMNRAIDSGRTVMVREIAKDTKLKSKTVRDALIDGTRMATVSRPVASVSAPAKRIPLIDFGARGPNGSSASDPIPSRGRGRGVSYNAGGGRRTIPDAFIARTRSGHVGVFVRAGAGARKSPGAWSKNLPIRQLFGPSLGHVFNKYRDIGIARMQEAFVKNFDHEMVFAGAVPPPLPPEPNVGA